MKHGGLQEILRTKQAPGLICDFPARGKVIHNLGVTPKRFYSKRAVRERVAEINRNDPHGTTELVGDKI